MPVSLAAGFYGVTPAIMDRTWDRARRTFDRHVAAHLHAAGMTAADIHLTVREMEHPQRPGHPALRLEMAHENAGTIVYLDWRGNLSWKRSRRWLDVRIMDAIARRRWILAMQREGLDAAGAPFEVRRVHPLLDMWASMGHIDMDTLLKEGASATGRYHITPSEQRGRSSHGWHDHIHAVMPGMPEMDIHVDHDRVRLYRLALSSDIVLENLPDDVPKVRLKGYAMPVTVMTALSGQRLDRLVASPLISPNAMPVIDRVRMRASSTIEAVLRRTMDGELDMAGTAHA